MRLAIDIGNSRTKLGYFDGKKLLQSFILENNAPESFYNKTKDLPVEDAILASVNPKVESKIDLNKINFPILRLSHSLQLPFKIKYQTPKTLGLDRIAVVAAGQMLFPNTNVLLIDVGSCITYDFLTAAGNYCGGAIAPGVQMRLSAMHNHTGALPLINWDGISTPKLVGDSTNNSLLSGAINGTIAELKETINCYQTQYQKVKILLTGGDAIFFEKVLKNGIFADPNLVLKGLNEILIYNRE